LSRRAAAAEETGRVESLNHDGEGVVRAGKTAFVGGALPGESVRFRRRRRHRQHDEAELLEVIEPSAARVTPRCAHFGLCGGCAMQHLDGDAQLAHKQDHLRESLERIGKVAPARWLEPLRGPQWQYRRRARLGARFVHARGRSLVGFRERLSSYIAELHRCEVLAPPVGQLLEPLGELLSALDIRERVPQIEVAVGESAVVLVLRALDEPTTADLSRLEAFEARHGVRLYIQRGGVDTMQPLAGAPAELHYTLPDHDVRLDFTPGDFVQVNAGLNRLLVASVLELLGLDAGSQVLDLYCGLGNFTLPMARRAASVTGVEGDAGLVARARDNARRNGIANAEFHAANLAGQDHAAAAWARRPYSHVLLDPPRAGAAEVLPLVAASGASRVAYVACHPASLARDLGILVHEHGYELLAAGIADMFPQTAHVESIALLAPRGKGRR
jgi:23S rRNA (uracil1939-C5)-methyltransferase